MDVATGLADLEAQVARDLASIAWPSAPWVKPVRAPNGTDALNVLIIGAGQGGLTLGLQLRRECIDRVMIIDRAAPEDRGPWKTYGRMITLRSPKFTTGPDLDIPSLTFQSWYTAQLGAAAWEELGKIQKEMWSDYLAWYEHVLHLPVRQPVEALEIRPGADLVAVDLATPDGPETVYARHVILATGIESTGRWWMPEFLTALPRGKCQHTSDDIDFTAHAGKCIAILGAGASAFDNAAEALETGASEVHLFWRREEIQRIQPYKQISYAGFLRHLGDLDDAMRWRITRYLLRLREAFPAETWDRVTSHPNVTLHPGSGWTDARQLEDGGLEIDTIKGPFRCDHVIAGTGFDVDAARCPLLGPLANGIARWSDRYDPPEDERDDRLARYPYLGPHFELLPRTGLVPGVDRIRLFTFGATMSFGPSGSSINALKFAVPRLISGITRALFEEDSTSHVEDLIAYDTSEFDLTLRRDREV